MSAKERVTKARSHLILDNPFFGVLALRLRLEEDAATDTASVDGTTLRYNAQYVAGLSDRELQGVLAHEVMHCALGHPWRCGARDLAKFNVAGDYAINGLLMQHGFTLPGGLLHDAQYDGLAAETIYARLGDQAPDPAQPSFARAPQPAQPEQGDEAGAQPAPMTAADWQIASEQVAMVARKAGKMPGDVDRAVKDARQSSTDWRTILRRFLEQAQPSDYSWTRPNRRFVAQGLYLPGIIRENMPRIGVAVDTSGSIGSELLALFASELTAIVQETRPACVEVVYADSRVQGVEMFTPDDELTLHARGGGGTRFQPALDYFSDSEEPPACVLYLTDLEADAPTEPAMPVLWVTPESVTLPAPFGELVHVSSYS